MEAQNLNPALDLFSAPAMDESKENVHYIEYRPISSYKDDSSIEFEFKTSGFNYFYPKRSYIHLKFKVKKANGTNMGDDDLVAYASLPLQTFFKEVEVFVNNTRLSTNVNYNYKSYINMLINYDICEKKGYLESQGYTQDDYKFPIGTTLDTSQSISHSEANKMKTQKTKTSKEVEFIGPLFEDFFQVDRAILPQTTIRLKLTRSSDTWFLYNCWKSGTGASATPVKTAGDFQVSLEEVTFTGCMIKVTPEAYMAHNKALEKGPALYPMTKTELRVYNIPTGSETESLQHLFGGDIPKKVAISLVTNKAFKGAKDENPTIFKTMNVQNVSLHIDGQRIGPQLNYKDEPMKAFHNMYTSYNLDQGITFKQFTHGHTIMVFNIDPEIHNMEQSTEKRRGESRIELSFSAALDETVSCLVYAEYPVVMTIDKDGKVNV